MDHNTESFLNVVLGVCLILLLAAGLYLLTKKFRSVPYSVLLVVVGIAVSPLHFEPFEAIRLSPGSVLFIFLPILLFESAFNFEFKEFKKILLPGFLLATVGLLISAIIVALPLSLIFNVDPLAAFLFGSVISSTDPIAVLSIFKQLGVPKKLQLLVDGESFLNDGTSVIMFRLLVPFVVGSGAALTGSDLVFGIGNFVYVIVGGVVVGIALGWLFSQLLSLIKNVNSVEIALTIILSHLVFILADHYLKVSGIIAVLAAGLVVGNYGRSKISPKVAHSMHQMWDFLVFVATSIVFLLIGYEIRFEALLGNLNVVAIATVALLLGRAVSVYLLGFGYNAFAKLENKIHTNWMHIANWGGLRGALPLIVILSLPDDFQYRELFIQLVLGAIFFTLVVNALTIKNVIKFLGVDKLNKANEIEIDITELFILQNLLNYLSRLREIEEIGEITYNKYTNQIRESLSKVNSRIKEWLSDNSQQEYQLELERIVRRYAVQVEKSVYVELYAKGVISESIYNRLRISLDYQIDCIDCDTEQFGRKGVEKILAKADEAARASNRWVILKGIPKKFTGETKSAQIKEYYMHHKARMLGDERVISELVNFETNEVQILSEKIVGKIRQKYVSLFEYNNETLANIEKEYPQEALAVEESFIKAESHELVERILEQFGEQNRISHKALQSLHLPI